MTRSPVLLNRYTLWLTRLLRSRRREKLCSTSFVQEQLHNGHTSQDHSGRSLALHENRGTLSSPYPYRIRNISIRCAIHLQRSNAANIRGEREIQHGPNRLVVTLLVYGALPRLSVPSEPPTTALYARAQTLRKAMKDVSKLLATWRVRVALCTLNGPQKTSLHAVLLVRPVPL